jgi:hypothetical protein
MGGLPHEGMDHEVWRISLDDLCCLRLADYMALEGCELEGQQEEGSYHICAELCTRHGGEVGRTGVVFTSSYDCYSAHLPYLMSEKRVKSSWRGTFMKFLKHGWHHLAHLGENVSGCLGHFGRIFGHWIVFEKYESRTTWWWWLRSSW